MRQKTNVTTQQVELIRRDYVANGGWETFLSYEDPDQDILIGLLRLRQCSAQTFRPELLGGASIVRELHVYGSVVPVSGRDPRKVLFLLLLFFFFYFFFFWSSKWPTPYPEPELESASFYNNFKNHEKKTYFPITILLVTEDRKTDNFPMKS